MDVEEWTPSYRGPTSALRAVFQTVLVLLSGTVTGGCLSLTPPTKVPTLPVPSSYPADTESTRSEDGAMAAATSWRDYFADERLQALLAQGLENNRDLRTAVLRVEEARANYGIQRADRFPTVDVGANAVRIGVPSGLSPSGQSGTYNEYLAGADFVSWELDFWGRVRSLNGAALQNFLAADATRRAATISG